MFPGKCAKNLTFFSQTTQKMTKKNYKVQQILVGNVKMDTQTIFHTNGDVNIFPCGWVDEQVTSGGCRRPKGRMTIEEDGTSHFHAYRSCTGSRYRMLYETSNGEVKCTRRMLLVTLRLPLGIGRIKMIEALVKQVGEIVNYIKSLKENIAWV